jgi:hypothetical protein
MASAPELGVFVRFLLRDSMVPPPENDRVQVLIGFLDSVAKHELPLAEAIEQLESPSTLQVKGQEYIDVVRPVLSGWESEPESLLYMPAALQHLPDLFSKGIGNRVIYYWLKARPAEAVVWLARNNSDHDRWELFQEWAKANDAIMAEESVRSRLEFSPKVTSLVADWINEYYVELDKPGPDDTSKGILTLSALADNRDLLQINPKLAFDYLPLIEESTNQRLRARVFRSVVKVSPFSALVYLKQLPLPDARFTQLRKMLEEQLERHDPERHLEYRDKLDLYVQEQACRDLQINRSRYGGFSSSPMPQCHPQDPDHQAGSDIP